jgi:hypothetical protein
MAKVKISELPALTPATLDTTFVVGISGSTTYKISINQLTSSLDTTFATDLVTAALSSSLNSKLSTSSFNSYTTSYTTDSSSFNSRIISGSAVAGTISSSIQISGLGFITASTPTDLSSLNTISASYLSFTQSYYSASSSFDSRIDGLENATSSYLTSLNGAISSSAQVLNGSGIFSSSAQLPTGLVSSSSQITSLGFITSSTPTDLSALNTISASYLSFTQSYYSASASFDSRIIAATNEQNLSGYATTSSLNIISASAWGAFQSASSYSASLQNSISASNYNITIDSASVSSLSSSFNTRITNINDVVSQGVPAGTISGSSQITPLLPTGVVSSSAQTILNLPTGVVSGSSQLTSSYDTRYASISGNQSLTGSVIISGSLTITGSIGANLYQLSDVNDTLSGSIVNGYQLAWNSSTSQWEAAAGAAAKGTTRLFISAARTNGNPFFFTAIQITSDNASSADHTTAFMITSNLLSKVTVYLRQDNAGPNSVLLRIDKNADGAAFSAATAFVSSSLSLSANTVQTYTFSNLTLTQFDNLHFYCDPVSSPGQLYGIVVIE